MSFAPKTIPFNIIDRSYLIPETEDIRGNYFPMSLICVVKLKVAVSKEQLINALQTLIKKYPQLRLAYQLDYENLCWQRIPEIELMDYLASCVHVLSSDSTIEDTVSELIRFNNEPLSQAVNFFTAGDFLLLRMHHSFSDGKFLYLLMQLLLTELKGQVVENVNLSGLWQKSIASLIWDNLGQGMTVLWQFTKSLFSYYQDYRQDTHTNSDKNRSPIQSGSAMAVVFKTISTDCLATLNEVMNNVSLNTLLQLIIGEQLKRLNLQEEPITYTIPVDLRRYLRDSNLYYPGNLASQIRVTLVEEHSLPERAVHLQKQIDEELEKRMPLAAIPGEWLLLLSGSKNYQSVNRDWLLKSTNNDSRVFVLSNLGNLDEQFTAFTDFLAEDFSPQLIIPLMGSPSLVFSFNTFCGQGNITLTYDPLLYNRTQIAEVLNLFDSSQLQNIIQDFLQ